MKVALFSVTNDITNGIGNITHEFCSELAKRKDIEFTLYTSRSQEHYTQNKYQIKSILPKYVVEFGNPIKKILKLQNPFHIIRYLTFDLPEKDYDLYHSIGCFPYTVLIDLVAKKRNKPFIVGEQGTYAVVPFFKTIDGYFTRRAVKKAARIIVPSKYTRDVMKKFSRVDREIDIIHNGVNFARFQKQLDLSELKKRYGTDSQIILSVGGLKLRKGFDITIKAFKKVKEKIPSAKYIIIGEGKQEKNLKKLVTDLNIKDLFFLKRIQGDELVKYFQFCDVYAHTPRNISWHFEGFGIVYLEASACGKPIVGAKSGGVPDAVVDGETGFLVPENDEIATEKAIMKLLLDKELAKRLGENGRKYAEQHDWKDFTNRIVEIYHELLN